MQDKRCNLNCVYCHFYNENNYKKDKYEIKHNKGFIVNCDYYGNRITHWDNCKHYCTQQEIIKKHSVKFQDYIFVFIGASASGKDTAIRYLKDKHNFQPIISHTTRPIREGEKQNIDYHFISKRTYNKYKKQDLFFDERKYETFDMNTKTGKNIWYYGIAKNELLKEGHKVCAVDLVGLQNLIDYVGKDKLIVLYLKANENSRKQRAQKRGGYLDSEWNRRLRSDEEIFTEENLKKLDINIIPIDNNGQILNLYDKIENIIKAYIG